MRSIGCGADERQSARIVTLGSTRAARRAGTKHASAAIASSNAGTAMNVTASVALTSKSSFDTARVSAADASSPIAIPIPATPSPSPEHETMDLGRARAQREANADLARAATHGVRHHPVDADRSEDERERREYGEQRGSGTCRPPRSARPARALCGRSPRRAPDRAGARPRARDAPHYWWTRACERRRRSSASCPCLPVRRESRSPRRAPAPRHCSARRPRRPRSCTRCHCRFPRR